MKVPFSVVSCGDRELSLVREVLESGWLTTASKAAEFEDRFKREVGADYACAVNSGTAALHLGLEAMGVKPGDRVFVPTMTFTASAEVVRYLGAHPVFLDVEYGTCLLTPDIVERAVGDHPDVKCLMAVHYGGQAAQMVSENGKGILDICQRNSVRVIEDAAHAFPARIKGRTVGSLGDVTCFSFYANKTITTAEGGMLATDDEHIYKRAKLMRLHGIDRDIWNRYTSRESSWEYDVVAPGYKYNMPDLNAAVGLAQLERAHAMREERERCARFYYQALAKVEAIDLPVCRVKMEDHAWHLFPIVLKEEASIDRNAFIRAMADKGIGTSVHFKPLHRMSYYREEYGLAAESFPNAEKLWRGIVSLPIYPALTEEELDYVCSAVKSIVL